MARQPSPDAGPGIQVDFNCESRYRDIAKAAPPQQGATFAHVRGDSV